MPKITLHLFSLASLLLASAALAADAQPAARPANIDQVVALAPITLNTNGVTPQEAFNLLSHETGIAFAATRRVPMGGNGASVPINLWGDRIYPKMDFDLQAVTFWQAVDRICVKAQLHVYGGDRLLTIYPGHIQERGEIFDGPIARVHAVPQSGYRDESSIHGGLLVITDVPAGLQLTVDLDPRVTLSSWSDPVIESARDDAGHDVQFQPLTPGGMGESLLNLSYLIGPWPATAKSLKTFVGYIPVTVVLASKRVKIPLVVGAKCTAGLWTIELVDAENTDGQFGAEVELFIGIEKADKDAPPLPGDLHRLVHLQDENGQSLFLEDQGDSLRSNRYSDPHPRSTVTGGIRQRFIFSAAADDGTVLVPAVLLIDIPTDSKPAAIPFEFKDLKLP